MTNIVIVSVVLYTCIPQVGNRHVNNLKLHIQISCTRAQNYYMKLGNVGIQRYNGTTTNNIACRSILAKHRYTS